MARPPTQATGGKHPAEISGGEPEASTPQIGEQATPPDFYRTLIECAPIHVVVVATDGRRWLSPSFKRLFGSRPDASVAEVVTEIVHPADRDKFFAILTNPTGTDPAGGAEPGEVRLRGRDGQWHALSFLTADLRDRPGIDGVVYYGFDVTQSRAAEKRERQILEEHNLRLAALSALKSEFISIVSHELRTPLTSISSFTEMLTGPGELTSPDAPAAVSAIARNTDRMLVLVQDLRLLSQLETGDQAVASGAVDVADLTREVGHEIDLGNRVIAVRHEVGEGPLVHGDEQLLRQLIHTLVGTVAACAAGDELTLIASADDTGWTICASAPSAELATDEQLLATPLPVLDDASRQRSAALSVLLARAIAQSHGGTLVTEVRPGATATIAAHLPFGGPRGLAPDQPAPDQPAPDQFGPDGAALDGAGQSAPE
jgi:hypothetical protein